MDWKFHPHCHGPNIHLEAPGWRARRLPNKYDSSRLFSNVAIPSGQTVSLLFKCEWTECIWQGGPLIGFTNQDPNRLDPSSLPYAYDPDEVLTWAMIMEQPSHGSLSVDYTVDDLGCVRVQHAGQLRMVHTKGEVDFKRPVWAMIELCGFYNSVLIRSSCPYVPLEIKSLGAEKNQLFLEALEYGSKNEQLVHVMVLGQYVRDTMNLIYILQDAYQSLRSYGASHYLNPVAVWNRKDLGSAPESLDKGTTVLEFCDASFFDGYQLTNQIFFPLSNVFLLVFDLREDLDQKSVRHFTSHAPESMDEGDEPTLWEAMDYQMRTIHAAVGNSNHSSPIIIVGTNGESLSEDSAERTRLVDLKFCELRKRLHDVPYKQSICSQFFQVGNRSMAAHDPEVTALRSAINHVVASLPSAEQEIPIKWIEWRTEVQKLQDAVESVEGIRQKTSSATSNMADSEFWLMLEYYHKVGHILCMDWFLNCPNSCTFNSTIILKPSIFSRMVDFVPSPASTDPDLQDAMSHEKTLDFLKDIKRLNNEGILEERLLNHCFDSKFNMDLVIDFMTKMDLLCEQFPAQQSPCVESPMGTSQGQGSSQRTFFMPSAIHGKGATSACTHKLESSTIFYICFGSLLLDSLFSRLVVRALAWSQMLEDTEQDLRISFRQAFVPIDGDHEAHLTLSSCRNGHIKVCVSRLPVITMTASSSSNMVHHGPPSAAAACKVKDFITQALDAIQSLSTISFKYQLSTPCPCTPEAPLHFLALNDCLAKDRISCPKKPGLRICTKSIREKFVPHDEASKGEYFMSEKHLLVIASRIGVEWEKLATLLGFSADNVARIKLDNPFSVERAIFSMLIQWSHRVETQSSYSKAAILKSALKECDREDVADEL